MRCADAPRRAQRPRRVAADVLADLGADELEQDAVAPPEVGHDLVASQLDERQHPSQSVDRVGVVLVHIALIVDRAQLVFGAPVRRAPGRHVDFCLLHSCPALCLDASAQFPR